MDTTRNYDKHQDKEKKKKLNNQFFLHLKKKKDQDWSHTVATLIWLKIQKQTIWTWTQELSQEEAHLITTLKAIYW